MTTLAGTVGPLTTAGPGGERPPRVPHHRVAVIGAGFGGIGTVIRLRREGITDVVVFEKAGDVGGTWLANRYPGCQCDVPSHLYSFSFAPNPDWSRTFATQPEIEAYLRRVVDEHRVRPHVRFHHEVLDARWSPGERRWAIRTTGGDHTADVLVSAHGGLSHPSTPELEGLERFAGAVFHSAAWDEGHDLDGSRVAVIGTGASAVQIVPSIQPRVRHLSVFQRTPGWVFPRFDRPVPARRRALFRRVPALQRANRAWQYVTREALIVAFTRPALAGRLRDGALAHLHRQVADPDLRARLTPTFTPGCKRLLLSNEYFPALCRPNVSLVTEGIASIDADGIVDGEGRHHDLDTIILATGFAATEHPIEGIIHGLGGRTLRDARAAGGSTLLGINAPGFPNLFLLMGPNTGLGHTSIVYMLEAQIDYVASCLAAMDRHHLDALDVRPAAADAFDREMQARLATTVWNSGGCRSWYLGADGRNPTMWPGFTFEYRLRTRQVRLSRYRVLAHRAPVPVTR